MTPDAAMSVLAGGLAGFATARILVAVRTKAPPARLMRTNINGQQVPVVLGGPLALGSLTGMALVAMTGAVGWGPGRAGSVAAGIALLIVVLTLAGGLDDRRGNEPDKGFRGHLRAARGGRLTGGLVKLGAGGLAGLAAGALVDGGVMVMVVGAAVALGANLVNLTDRAPGRAGKVWLLVAVPLMVWGDPGLAVAAAPLAGALFGCLGADLGERGMLGDAGANPVGFLAGVGAYVAFPQWALVAALLGVLGLQVLAETVTLSKVIASVPPLRGYDRLGRVPEPRTSRKSGDQP